jgi:hypothetical protein
MPTRAVVQELARELHSRGKTLKSWPRRSRRILTSQLAVDSATLQRDSNGIMNHGPQPPYWSIAIEPISQSSLDSVVGVRATLVGDSTRPQLPLCVKRIAWKAVREKLLSVGFRLFADPEMKDAAVKLRNGTTIKGWLDGPDRVDELQTIGFETMSWRQFGS